MTKNVCLSLVNQIQTCLKYNIWKPKTRNWQQILASNRHWALFMKRSDQMQLSCGRKVISCINKQIPCQGRARERERERDDVFCW